MAKPKSIGSGEIHAAIERLAAAILERHPPGKERLILLGIANGGRELCRRISGRIHALDSRRNARCGTLDVSFHRDDIGIHPIPKEFAPTEIAGDVDGAVVILIDDVLFTGRTVKAAIEELFDHGRPVKVELAVLADRGGRLLPITADYVGMPIEAHPKERVKVRLNPDNPLKDSITVEQPESVAASPS